MSISSSETNFDLATAACVTDVSLAHLYVGSFSAFWGRIRLTAEFDSEGKIFESYTKSGNEYLNGYEYVI